MTGNPEGWRGPYKNTDADDRVSICKIARYIVLRGVEQGKSEGPDKNSHVQVGDPSCKFSAVTSAAHNEDSPRTSFIRKPDLSFNLDRCSNLLRYPDLGRDAIDSMIVPHRGHLAVFIALSLWDIIVASVAGSPA